ncbi:MAG: TonB-dependent receptor [Bacteroidetes bacterium]|nr:TonB-dependent receptor [Bacteroidota bacterium]
MHRLAVLFFLFLSLHLSAQEKGSIEGFVRDAGSGLPLSDANITLEPSHRGATSDAMGWFSIPGIKPGEYTLSVRFLGYVDQNSKVTVNPGRKSRMEISLNRTSVNMGEVVIQAEKPPEVEDEPIRIATIPASRIEALPALQITGVMDLVSGVNVYNPLGIFSSKTIVSMRGLSGNDQSRVLVLMDGIPLNKADGGSVNWNQINKDRIENVRILKGPGQARYGGGAMGGVIEMTTKKPSDKLEGFVKAEYGTYNTFGGDANLSGKYNFDRKLSGLYWSLDGFASMSDGYITEAEEFTEEGDSILVPTFLKEYNITGKLGMEFRKGHSAEIQTGYYDDIRGNGVEVFEEYGAYSEHDTYFNMLRYKKKGNFLDYDIDIYSIQEYYDRIYEYMNEGEYMLYDVDARRGDLGANGNLSYRRFRQHNIMAGFEMKHGMVNATDTYYTSTDIIHNAGKMNTWAFYLQDDIRFAGEKLHLYAGLRYNFARYYDGLYSIEYPSYSIKFMTSFQDTAMAERQWQALCPGLSLQFQPNEEKRIYISASRGFRAPILDDMTRTGKKKGSFAISNPDLKPELLDNYEIGGDLILFGKLTLGASVYYSIGHDFMYYVSTGDSVNMGYKIAPVFQKRNISKVEIYGAEADVEYRMFSFLTGFLNYSYSHSTIRDYEMTNPEVDTDLTGKHLTDVPDHKLTAGLAFRSHGWTGTITMKYIGKRWINDQNIVDTEYLLTDQYPAYTIFSAKVEKRFFNSFMVGASIDNIFDVIYIEDLTQRPPGRFIMVQAGYYF